jgi:hypothetical protein
MPSCTSGFRFATFPNPRFGSKNPERRGYYEIHGLPPGDDTGEVERMATH